MGFVLVDWALMGQALMGRALMGQVLMGRALMVPWAICLFVPLAPDPKQSMFRPHAQNHFIKQLLS